MNRIAALIIKQLRSAMTSEEEQELREWMELSETNKRFVEQYTQENVSAKLEKMASIDWKKGYRQFRQKSPLLRQEPEQIALLPNRERYWRRWIAAAAILAIIGTAAFFLWFNSPKPSSQAPATTGTGPYKNDIGPGGYKALLSLGNDKTIVLDTASSATLAGEGSSARNEKGALTYQPVSGGDHSILTYNTVTTPRGGYYRVVLPDGTRVWLNAASSIQFPTVFTGSERRVSITGEVYFEVAKNRSKPFIVTTGQLSVEVLGTHFNINAYDDEPSVNTTLLKGNVRVSSGPGTVTLNPGQQARLTFASPSAPSSSIKVETDINTEEVIAWKENHFRFEGAQIETVMRQIARWYDVQIVYQGRISTQEFVATIDRDEPVSKLLKLLEATNEVHFSIEGKTIYVRP